MGQAYRDSGRTTPIMDGFAFHPYEDNSSIAPVSGTHPNTTTIALADYHKLVALLGEAFPDGVLDCRSGTTSSASSRRSRRRSCRSTPAPSRRRRSRCPRRRRPPTTGRRSQLAFCQPNVRGLFLFHSVDETELAGLAVGRLLRRRHAEVEPRRRQARRSRSRGAASSRTATVSQLPRARRRSRSAGAVLTLTCDLDCSYVAQLYRLPGKLLVDEARARDRRQADDAAAARPEAERRRTGSGSRPSRR